jgi:hypothetical protein
MKPEMRFPHLNQCDGDISEFIEFWAALYDDKNEGKYERNIGKLTEDPVNELFFWKNGGPLSEIKMKSVRENLSRVRTLSKDVAPEQFLQNEVKGGMIWRIFFLHIWDPSKYPIFDQHVYRAMVYLKTGQIIKDLPHSDREKQAKYIEEYLPFYFYRCFLGHHDGRKLDKALWILEEHDGVGPS